MRYVPCHGGILANVVQVIFPAKIIESLGNFWACRDWFGDCERYAGLPPVFKGRELGRVRLWARKSVVKK
jgi:hypothetical protein